ncbi:MAG: GreA/GreB family elongation factor [Bdellovibrionales bacterium]|nr:GreA/GreB family elongation factor [Bdellovibrionales bacterium]
MNPNPLSTSGLKRKALDDLISHLELELQGLIQSAKAAHLAATHEETRAEDRHDTFAIEASYLAAGQAARVAELQATLLELEQHLESSANRDRVEVGSLVTLSSEDRISLSLIANHGGGTRIRFEGNPLSLVSPLSPLGENLIGLKSGDEFEVESKSGTSTFRVMGVE